MRHGGYLVFIIFGFLILVGLTVLLDLKAKAKTKPVIQYLPPPPVFVPPVIDVQSPLNLPATKAPMRYLDYAGVVNLMRTWNQEAPEITEMGTYGKSSQGEDIWYFRIHNPRIHSFAPKPRVLITACIHGDEKISTATVLGCMSNMLINYDKLDLGMRDVYFIPIVSPDSYKAHKRHVDGLDPNRDFPHPRNPQRRSVAPITALRAFFMDKQFQAAACGHAYGRVLIYPSGQGITDNDADYRRICGEMTRLAGYSSPYRTRNIGTSKDFYHYNGAFGITWEFGRSKKPSESAIPDEIKRAYQAMLYFIKEAPLVKIK
tara:strand:- start:942 stop:1892 length:951 start_codon:yes stop_codon:yes gene_type:complete